MQETTEQVVWQALRAVIEPDLGENIVDLGLVQSVRSASQGVVQIDITMTTPYSSHADAVADEVRRAADRAGTPRAEVRLMTEPTWTPYRMAEPLRVLLGLPANEPQPPAQVVENASWRSRLRAWLAGS